MEGGLETLGGVREAFPHRDNRQHATILKDPAGSDDQDDLSTDEPEDALLSIALDRRAALARCALQRRWLGLEKTAGLWRCRFTTLVLELNSVERPRVRLHPATSQVVC